MASENEPAVEPETEAAEKQENGKLVYRVGEPEFMRFREAGDGEAAVIEGVMVPYDEWTEINSRAEGHFMERFAPGSVAKTLKERGTRIRALFEHGMDSLGLQPIATFDDFRDEADAAHYEASLFRSVPELIVEGLRRGVYGTSIRFKPIKWDRVRSPKPSEHNPDGLPEHTIREAFIKEFSIVTFPAYEGATAKIRSFTDAIETRHDEQILKDPDRLIALIRAATTSEPQHSEPAPAEPEEGPAVVEESRRTRPSRDWLSTKEGETSWL